MAVLRPAGEFDTSYAEDMATIRRKWQWVVLFALIIALYTLPFYASQSLVALVGTDRGGDGKEDRYTPVNHRFLCNAEALLNMSRRRLCYQASKETREVMLMIKEAIREIDPALAKYMQPNCVYRGGICPEPKPCGNYKISRYNPEDRELTMRIEG